MNISTYDIGFVGVQLLLFASYVFDALPLVFLDTPTFFIVGLGVFLAGMLIGFVAVLQLNVHLSPFPSPLPGAKLITNGLFKYVRHPIYTGILLSGVGFAIISTSGYRLIITFLLYVLFHFKAKYEEQQLQQAFDSYSAYKRKTGRFLPKLFNRN